MIARIQKDKSNLIPTVDLLLLGLVPVSLSAAGLALFSSRALGTVSALRRAARHIGIH